MNGTGNNSPSKTFAKMADRVTPQPLYYQNAELQKICSLMKREPPWNEDPKLLVWNKSYAKTYFELLRENCAAMGMKDRHSETRVW